MRRRNFLERQADPASTPAREAVVAGWNRLALDAIGADRTPPARAAHEIGRASCRERV